MAQMAAHSLMQYHRYLITEKEAMGTDGIAYNREECKQNGGGGVPITVLLTERWMLELDVQTRSTAHATPAASCVRCTCLYKRFIRLSTNTM